MDRSDTTHGCLRVNDKNREHLPDFLPGVHYYTSHQIAIAYDNHLCSGGIPDIETRYRAYPWEDTLEARAYCPSFYVPSRGHTVVIVDRRFSAAHLARAWMADRIRELLIRRRDAHAGQ